MIRWSSILVAAAATAVLLYAVTLNGSLQVLGTLTASIVDFTGAVSTAPMKSGAALPASCAVGQAFFKTDAAPGQNIYLCTAGNTWTQVQGSGAGPVNPKPDPNYISLVTDFSTMNYAQASPIYAGGFMFARAVGSNYLSPSGSGSMPSALPAGVVSITTSATANDRQGWGLRSNSLGNGGGDSQSLYALTTYDWEIVVIFRYPASTDYANSNLVIGLLEDTTSDPNRGLGVRFLAGTDSYFTFYTANTMGDGYTSALSTGLAPDTNWHKLRIRSDGTTAYKIYMSLDGGAEASVCPSGCSLTASTTNSSYWGAIGIYLKTLEAAAKRVHLDYAHFWADLRDLR